MILPSASREKRRGMSLPGLHAMVVSLAMLLLGVMPLSAQVIAARSDVEHRHVEILLRLADAVGNGDTEAFARLYAPDAVLHGAGRRGRAGTVALLRDLRGLVPDARWTIDLVIAQGHFASARGHIEGTSRGRRVRFEVITQHRFEQERIVEQWEQYDSALLPP